ncbi:MAG TPA: SDR family NAD(P)-dependent oxidoreductase [Thermoanaerobaculia bacterium]|nr:SDR family NAD(P)-dependent oxidoreductase [Thermoanaerobaculia bacterium]
MWTTLVEILRFRAATQANRAAYRFLSFSGGADDVLTYADLDRRARAIAAELQRRCRPGDRALLLYSPCIEFTAAYFGCLYAGVVAIPAYPPRATQRLGRLRAIVDDAQAVVALSTSDIAASLVERTDRDEDNLLLPVIATDLCIDPEGWREPEIDGRTLTFLQYTSGSTGNPKGVMVSHENLLVNLELIDRGWRHGEDSVMMTWLPTFHDMGLIYGMLQPLYGGFPCVIMSPQDFIKQPLRWLEAISRFRGTHTTSPNFGYELCLRKITPEQIASLDLRSLKVAMNAAEPVRADTVRRFAETFAGCGFDPIASCPAYGLAEGTLVLTLLDPESPTQIVAFDAEALGRRQVVVQEEGDGRGRVLVGCGVPGDGVKILIVDPETRMPCPPDRIGEIWASGETIAQGYWRRSEATEETFFAVTADGGEDRFLRTGDLGFLYQGELFINGRIKDVIIIRGQNYYPQDLENSVVGSHPSLRPGCGAIFALEGEGDSQERLVAVQEVYRSAAPNLDAREVFARIRQAVAEEFDLDFTAIVLVDQGTIGKTSSGKIQRQPCRLDYLNDRLHVVAQWRRGAGSESRELPPAIAPPAAASTERRQREELASRLIALIAPALGVAPGDIEADQPLSRYGMSSVIAVDLARQIEEAFGRPLPAGLLYEYPTLEALGRLLGDAAPEVRPAAATAPEAAGGPIAVLGMSCRLPGAADPEAFWQLLEQGIDAVGPIPRGRAKLLGLATQGAPGLPGWPRGGYLEDVDRFDDQFFHLSPREAERMDPQQRLLLEAAYEALGDAAISPERLAGSPTGVFVGISSHDYERLQAGAATDAYDGTGNASSIAANRLSYFLDLRGPSVAVDTACSSSLVALHLACRSLRDGDFDLALAGGVNLILDPQVTAGFAQAGMMAPDGLCKTFDATADGYVRGEGCGVVVLKRLADALRDGDPVLGLIRGTAINQDGRSNGLTAPNGLAQEAVVRGALADAGVEPWQIGYVETHGTGTPLGDPIEVRALIHALQAERSPFQRCGLGSVKTNIGHLEAAAGIASLIKVLLVLRHGRIPPHLHLERLNPEIDLGENFYIPRETTDWPGSEEIRLAGLSSFGFGGTNAHAIVEAPRHLPEVASSPRPLHLFLLSATSESGLIRLAASYERFLSAHPDVDLADLCFTASTGRAHLRHRLAALVSDSQGLREALRSVVRGEPSPAVRRGRSRSARPRIAFLFTGQGAQYPGMGRRLYELQPTFRQALDRCNDLIGSALGISLLAILFPTPEDEGRIHETATTQVALFALEFALAEMLTSWDVLPDAVLGHSIGEYVAACLAGAMSLEDALQLVATRGRLMQSLPAGGVMSSVFAGEERVLAEIADLAGKPVSIAAVNAPEKVVVSGTEESVARIEERLERSGIRCRRLNVSHAFHSGLIEPCLDAFEQAAQGIRFSEPRIPLYSNLTGGLSTQAPDATYWRRHARSPVRFLDGLKNAEAASDLFLELGPRPVLSALAAEVCAIPSLPTLRAGQDDWTVLLGTLGELWTAGVEIDWPSFWRDEPRRRLSGLPVCSFERQSRWFKSPAAGDAAAAAGRLVRVDALDRDPDLALAVGRIVANHSFAAGSISQVTGKRFLFLDSARQAFVFLDQRNKTLIAIDYNGPEPAYEPLIGELLDFARERGFVLHVLEETASRLDRLVRLGFSTTRVGTWQDIEDLGAFTLAGNRMRRLRYLVDRYRKLSSCETVEYTPESDPQIDREIESIMDDWAADKGVVAPFLANMKRVVRVGFPGARHRTFLVRREGRIEALIMILRSKTLDGYIMDMECYRSDVPLGCLEFGTVEIVDRLAAEGCKTLSLGLTLGTQLEEHPDDDPEVRNFFADLHRAGVLNGDANFQFKNKFRTRTEASFLCRHRAGFADPADVLQMLANPFQPSDLETLVELPSTAQAPHQRRAAPDAAEVPGETFHPLVHRRIDLAAPIAVFETRLSLTSLPYLSDHRILGAVLLPATAFLEMVSVAEAAASGAPGEPEITGFNLHEALVLPESGVCELQTVRSPAGPGASRVEIWSRPGERDVPWKLHASGEARARGEAAGESIDPEAILKACREEMSGEAFYALIAAAGYQYGARFQGVEHLWLGEGETLAWIRSPQSLATDGYRIHPALLDACLHACLPLCGALEGQVLVPVSLERFRLMRRPERQCWVHARALPGSGGDTYRVDLRLFDEGGAPVAELSDLLLRRTAAAALFREKRVGASADFHRLAWMERPRDLASGPAGDAHWLILSDQGGVGTALAELLERQGGNCSRVTRGEAFAGVAPGAWEVDGSRLGFDLLLAALDPGAPLRVVDLWSLDSRTNGAEAERDPFDVSRGLCARALAFVQSLIASPRGPDAQLWLVTGGVQAIEGSTPIAIEQAPLWGFGRVLAREHPELRGGLIDLQEPDPARAAGFLLPEITAPAQDREIAFSHGRRYAARLVEQAVAPPTPPLRFGSEGTYLLTGGLGALGLQVARWLVEKGARHLLLLGRQDPTEAGRSALEEMIGMGAEVTALRGDVADREQLDAAFAQIAASPAPLRGVIHAAGVLDDGILLQQTEERFEQVMRPKILGAWNLHLATRGLDLEHFVLFSSITSLLGTAGQGNYGAANAFLDALAHERRRQGLPAVSINWGPWTVGGMAASRDPRDKARWAAEGIGEVDPALGLAALEQLLSGNDAQVGVFPLDAGRLALALPGGKALLAELLVAGKERADTPSAALSRGTRAELLAGTEPERLARIVSYLRNRSAAVLHLQPDLLDVDKKINHLGMDSLTVMQLRNALKADLEVDVPAVDFFGYPTVVQLAAMVLARLAEAPTVTPSPISPPERPQPEARVQVDQLTDEEVEAMLHDLMEEN